LQARSRQLVLVALAAAGLALAALWIWVATLLWHTSVPGDLRMPDVEPGSVFTEAQLDAAHAYDRVIRLDYLLALLLPLVVLGVYARYGARFLKESAAGRIGSGMLLAMLGLGLVWLAALPVGLIEVWWQRRHGITKANYLDWIVGSWFGLGGEFLGISLAILIVMGLAGWLPRTWWIPGAAVFVGLALLFTFLGGYLTGGTRIHDRQLVADGRELARAEGIAPVPLDKVKVSTETTAPNAGATGLGVSRRIVFWDTILDGRFDRGELRVVLGHELGHHARNHLWKGVGWYALFAFPGALLIALATRRRGGMAAPEAVPLALFVLVGLSLLALPFMTAITRHMEVEADWAALEATKDPASAERLFEGFGTSLHTDPEPPTWDYVLFENHPTLMQRIEMARAWKARQG
jgi:STE24 endopeptidase